MSASFSALQQKMVYWFSWSLAFLTGCWVPGLDSVKEDLCDCMFYLELIVVACYFFKSCYYYWVLLLFCLSFVDSLFFWSLLLQFLDKSLLSASSVTLHACFFDKDQEKLSLIYSWKSWNYIFNSLICSLIFFNTLIFWNSLNHHLSTLIFQS